MKQLGINPQHADGALIIKTVDSQYFSIGGVTYPRVFMVVSFGNDDALILLGDKSYAAVLGRTFINGVKPTSQASLITALQAVVGSLPTMSNAAIAQAALADFAGSDQQLIAAFNSGMFRMASAPTYSENGVILAAAVAWDDGATGQYTAVESTVAPGSVQSLTITHVLNGVTKTLTQPAITYDADGRMTAAQPAMMVA